MASTLLAIDDSVTMRKVLEITFASPDFRVVTANSPDAALQKLKRDKPDLVISDLSLDAMNGYDLCKAIKKASPGTPVILLSSKQNAFDAAKGTAAQADDHMDKPFDTQQMIDKVKKLLAAQGGAKPNVSGTNRREGGDPGRAPGRRHAGRRARPDRRRPPGNEPRRRPPRDAGRPGHRRCPAPARQDAHLQPAQRRRRRRRPPPRSAPRPGPPRSPASPTTTVKAATQTVVSADAPRPPSGPTAPPRPSPPTSTARWRPSWASSG